ncbi:MAG TPA: AAA family ATPase [Candidatus Limnocylindrales bacterium]|nr:AAA family ATPase [Candidatus Limnocylindrales bacterium]
MTRVHVRARLLGAFEVEIDGRPLDRAAFERPSGLRVLKLLLATPEHRVRREVAAELLWPEADPDRSAGNLRKAIHFARRGLATPAGDDDLLGSEGEWLRLAPGATLDIDADRLGEALGRIEGAGSSKASSSATGAPGTGDALEVLATLGGSELLPDDPYEEWLVPLRERLRQRVQAVVLRAVADSRARGDTALAVRLVDRALALDPADELAHRAAIEMHLEAGHLHAARRQLVACRRAIAEAYGVEPSEELVALIDRAAADRVAAPLAEAIEPEIVGRRLELDGAESVLDAVGAGRLGALLLRGAPGIGKTRLLRELVRTTAAGGWRVVEIRGLELAADSAYASLGGALSTILDAGGVEAWPEPARSAILAIAPALRRTAGSRDAGAGAAPLLAFATDAGLRAGLLDGLRRMSTERPLVLAVDDVQWLDPATVALLGSALSLESSAVLLVLTLRDERGAVEPALRRFVDGLVRSGGTELRLGPLGRREIRLILERELEGAGLADGVADAIVDLAGGTPLYALELLRGAQESGAIALRDGEWRMTDPRSTFSVPEGVRRVVEDRTRRLDAEVRAILGVAAELGDEVTYELLVAASGADAETVLDALDEGLAVDLLEEQAGRYRFGHPLFRAALRRELPRKLRALLHGRIAAALARDVDPTDRKSIDAVIASGADALAVAGHATDAVELGATDALPLAVGFGLAAGSRQSTLFDYAAAAGTLRRALALWYRLPVEARADFPASEAQHLLGQALRAAGDQAAAAEAFNAEIATAVDDMARARGYAALSWLPYEHGRFDRSEDILRKGIDALHDPVARAFLESGLGWLYGRRGEWAKAHELLARAVTVLERAAPPDLLARSVDRLAVAIRDTGAADRSIPVFERALGLSIEAANAHEEAMVRMHFAGALRNLGDVDGARTNLERALFLCHLTGDRYIEAVTTWILAEVEDTAGRLEEAIGLRRAELEILGATGGNPQNQAMAHAHIAHLAGRLGDSDVEAVERKAARAVAEHSGIDHLPALVERALTARDWAVVAHRHHEDAPAIPAQATVA